ncbi:MAG: anthranilate phosphoribosyltransferase, partial [Firmicutes bacterium]|nr:anthranilate phosphoribosyltransferase [Bacillota bacterium]
SSKSGASDLLEALGVNIMLEPEETSKCINTIGIGFMNAQKFHKAMKNVAGVRRELGIRTLFNMMGPLSNPSNAKRQVIGVFDSETVPVFSSVMKALGVTDAVVVHGLDGMDELTTTTKTLVNEIKDGAITEYEIDPADYGIPYSKPEDLVGGTGADNAEITRAIFRGEKGPKRDIVVLNAGMGIYIGKKAADLAEGIKIAEEMIDSGLAAKKLEEMIELTNKLGG